MFRTDMNRRFRLYAAALGLVLFAASAIHADDPKSPITRFDLASGETVVFLGDSITHQCLYTQYVEDYYYTRFPDLKINFHNAGVGGATARDALDRFDRDVSAYKPKYVTVLLGMNDGGYKPYDEKTFETYHDDMTELVKKIREIDAVPVLMTPTMFDSRAARLRAAKNPPRNLELYNATLAYYGAWLRETAVESGAGFVDMYGPLNQLTLAARKKDANFTLIKDAVHPDPPGQLVMAYAVLRDLDSYGVVSDIRVTWRSEGSANVQAAGQAVGTTVMDLKVDEHSVEFTFTAGSLPFVVPPEAESGAKLVYLGHVLGRESLAISGLPAAKYELSLDGESVGTYPASVLAQGVSLEENTKTPQYKQALQVAELNKKRNDGPVKSLRNEWSQMQQFYRLQRRAKAESSNAEVARSLEAQAKKIEGLEDRIAKHEEAAREIETAIRKVNRPKSHQYRVALVAVEKASARISMNGKQLANAEILLDGEHGRYARGVTGADGTCTFRISDLVEGVAAGEYRVAIRAPGIPERLSTFDASGLRIVVKAGAVPNEFVLDLNN